MSEHTPVDDADTYGEGAASHETAATPEVNAPEAAKPPHEHPAAPQPSAGTPSEAHAAAAKSSAAKPSEEQPAAPQPSASESDPDPAPKPGSPPPGFGMPPDFEAFRPPPEDHQSAALPAYLKRSDTPWSVLGRMLGARARRVFQLAGERITQRTLRIGVSARIFHPEPGAPGLRGKTLQYLEESIAHWVMARDVLVFMIPTVGTQGILHPSKIRLRDYAKHLDGLLLQGGADVSPQTYGAADARPEWPGDRVRDMYELELLHEFIDAGKPVLGVCRGCQLINVAFGGTLYQDIATDVPAAGAHVSEHYDQHTHTIRFPDGAAMAKLFPHHDAIVNSIHHQAIRELGRDLEVEAVSVPDGIIEGIRYRRAPFVVGVQWHPEFHHKGGPDLLDCTPLLDTFLRAARNTRL